MCSRRFKTAGCNRKQNTGILVVSEVKERGITNYQYQFTKGIPHLYETGYISKDYSSSA
ncbi:MAG: hypothetical protein HC894_12850 [Microcoleus sp. SM1_3_4]|nr:hypothetical protein [Microcoleus sp. SM1_3_4]